MKKIKFLLLAASACCVCFLGNSVQAQVRIMPFGDSVTAEGPAPGSSYRYWLWHFLQDAGYNVDFVGNKNGVEGDPPASTDFDMDYEGGADNWTTRDALSDAQGSAAGQQPDIVLLDFGSNDIISGIDLTETKANLEQIIETFRAVKPDVIILIAEPTGWLTPDKTQKKLQSKLKGVVSQVAKEEGVIKVNQFGGFSPKKDTLDGTHPNVLGEKKIAKKYFSKLKKVLR